MNFDKKIITRILLFALVFIVIVLGSTFAIFNYTKAGDKNALSTSTVEFSATSDTLLDVESDFPQDADLSNEELVAMKTNHTGVLSVTGHNTLTDGVKYNIYVVHGDDITGKQRLADSSIKFQLEPDFTSGEDGFTVLTNNYATASNLVFDNNGRALISTGLVKDTTELTTVDYNFYMWLDADSMHVSSTMKRATLAEGNPSLADTTSGNVTSSRYLKNNGVLTTDVKLFPASSNEAGKIVYTTNEFSNGYYNIKFLVEAIDSPKPTPTPAPTATPEPFNSITYDSGCYNLTTLSNDTVKINWYNTNYYDENNEEHDCPTNNIVIPSSFDGRTVTEIGYMAFGGCDLTGSLTLPNNLMTIGELAFDGNNLSGTLVLPNTLTTIGDYAFSENNLSGDLIIPNSLDTLGSHAFEYNSGFTNVTIPNSITNLGYYPFGLSDYNDTIESLSIDIPYIDDSIFCEMGLSSLTLGEHVISIGYDTFRGNELTSITLPNSLTTIGEYAFAENNLSGNLIIPNSVTTIGFDAFAYNDGFTNVVIPNSVNSITYQVTNNENRYSLLYDTHTSSLSIDMTNIPNYLFENNDIDSVTLGEHVVSIGDEAFYSSGISTITIPNNVTTIGTDAFSSIDVVFSGKSCSVISSMTNYDWGANSIYGLNNENCLS